MPALLSAQTHSENELCVLSMLASAVESKSTFLLARDCLRRQTSPAAMRKSDRLALNFSQGP